MKRLLFLLALIFAVGAASGQELIRSTDMPDFQAITVSGNVSLELIPSDKNQISIDLYESSADRCRWSVTSDGTLSLVLRPTVGNRARADVKIHYKHALHTITLKESRLAIDKQMVGHGLLLKVTAGGSAKIAVAMKDLEIELSSNSAAMVTGEAKYLTIRAMQRSRVDTRELDAVAADVYATLGSEVFVHSTERMIVEARSGATVYRNGDVEIVKTRANIGADVFAIGEHGNNRSDFE